ncbi:MAG: bile acid:sodium symporter family protein, partial [Cryomorphaceae bacterium]
MSFIILMGFIAVALFKNIEAFKDHLYLVFFLVFIHNAIAYLLGFLSGKIARLEPADRRAIAIETGIQNSGLGLII